MHHRRARIEVLEVAQDRFRIRGTLAPPLLAGACPKQLRFRDHRDRRRGEREALEVGRHRQCEPRRAGGKRVPAGHDGHPVAVGAQHLLQYLAPPGRVSRQQHAALEVTQERIQRCERLLGAHVDAQLARRGGGEIAHLGAGTVQLGVRLEGIEGDRCEPGERRVELGRLQKQLRGPEHRTLDVVAAILVAGLDVLPGPDESLRQRRVVHDHRIRGQVVEQCRGRSEEQRLIELHPRGRESLAHAAINAGAGRIPLEARAVAAAEILHRFRIQRHLARRQ